MKLVSFSLALIFLKSVDHAGARWTWSEKGFKFNIAQSRLGNSDAIENPEVYPAWFVNNEKLKDSYKLVNVTEVDSDSIFLAVIDEIDNANVELNQTKEVSSEEKVVTTSTVANDDGEIFSWSFQDGSKCPPPLELKCVTKSPLPPSWLQTKTVQFEDTKTKSGVNEPGLQRVWKRYLLPCSLSMDVDFSMIPSGNCQCRCVDSKGGI